MMAAGRKARLMPKGECTSARLSQEIIVQPAFLGGPVVASTDLIAIAVERDDVPRAKIEAVVTARRIACARTEVGEVSRRSRRVVFVIAGRRVRDSLHFAP